jgi:signal transduction histidine kinase
MRAAALRPARLSLRARLLAITLALLAAGLVVSNVLVTGALRGHLVKRVDEQVAPLATAFSRLPPRLLTPGRDATFPSRLAGRTDLLSDLYVAHLTRPGDTDSVLRSPESADPAGPALPRLDERAVAARGGRPFETAGHGGDRWRVVVLRQAAGGSVVVAASLHGVNATIGRLRADCVLIGAAVMALLAAAGWFAVRAGLRPLHRIEGTAAAIAGGDLSHRVPDLAAPGTEVGRYLRTLAADALHDLRALDPGRPVRLTGPAGGPPATAPVLGDESRLRQAVTNLVGNAVTHTPAGTPVHITVGTEGDEAVLTVADEGPGLTEEQASLVFERFYRADVSRSRSGDGGAGLGLAIVHSVVAAHDGRVELRTAPDEGTAFRLVLPALTDDRAR